MFNMSLIQGLAQFEEQQHAAKLRNDRLNMADELEELLLSQTRATLAVSVRPEQLLRTIRLLQKT